MLCVHSKKLTFNNTYVQVNLQCYVKYKDVLFINVYVKRKERKTKKKKKKKKEHFGHLNYYFSKV